MGKRNDRHRDIDTARAFLIHALHMLNDLPTSRRVGSAVLHAAAAIAVLSHDEAAGEEARELLKKVKEIRARSPLARPPTTG